LTVIECRPGATRQLLEWTACSQSSSSIEDSAFEGVGVMS